MAEAKQRSEWDRMSLLCALTANCHSTQKQFTTDDFSPYAKKKEVIKDQKLAMSALKALSSCGKPKQIHKPKGS